MDNIIIIDEISECSDVSQYEYVSDATSFRVEDSSGRVVSYMAPV